MPTGDVSVPAGEDTVATGATLLAIGAHCDDCVIAIPGILIKAARRGYRVVIVAVVGDHANWPPAGALQGREADLIDGTTALCRENGAELLYLDQRSQGIDPGLVKARLAEIVARLEPEIAFLPWPRDHNDDHRVTAEAAGAALRYTGPVLGRPSDVRRHRPLYAYDTGPYHSIGFEPETFVDVSDEWPAAMEWLGRTMAVLSGVEHAPGFEHEALRVKATLGAYRGLACGVRHAEAVRPMDAFPRDIF